jgi:hypothetical protein
VSQSAIHPGSARKPAAVRAQQQRTLLAEYDAYKRLIKDWKADLAPGQSAEVRHEISSFFHDHLNRVRLDLESLVRDGGEGIDLPAVERALSELRVITAFNPEDVRRSQDDVRDGRVSPLGDLQSELDRLHK